MILGSGMGSLTPGIEHPTFNVQHPTSNGTRSPLVVTMGRRGTDAGVEDPDKLVTLVNQRLDQRRPLHQRNVMNEAEPAISLAQFLQAHLHLVQEVRIRLR